MDNQKAYTLLDEFFSAGKELPFKRRQTIIRYGEPAEHVYWIVSGAVKVFSHDESGNESIHHIYKPQEMFPAYVFTRDRRYNIGISAFTDTVVQSRPIAEAMDFIAKEPITLNAIVQQMTATYERVLTLNSASAE